MTHEFSEEDERFDMFMAPLSSVAGEIGQRLMMNPSPQDLDLRVGQGRAGWGRLGLGLLLLACRRGC